MVCRCFLRRNVLTSRSSFLRSFPLRSRDKTFFALCLVICSVSLILIPKGSKSAPENQTAAIMFMTRSEYDRGINTYSPEGRLFQVEYAIEAIKLGSTAIGIQTKEGCVLAVEKRITSPLLEPSSIEKIWKVDEHIEIVNSAEVKAAGCGSDYLIAVSTTELLKASLLVNRCGMGCAVSGLIADARTLVEKARVEALGYWFNFNERMSVESVTQAVSNLAIGYGTTLSRPFGVAMMFAGIDHRKPQLWHMDPSGTFIQFDAKAIGSGSEGAQQSLQEVYHKDMTMAEALKHAATILKQVMEEKINSVNIEIATVTPDKMYHLYTPAEVEQVLSTI